LKKIVFFCLCFISFCNPEGLKDRLIKASANNYQGAYVLTRHKTLVTLLRLHSYEAPYLYLEEISAPLKPVQDLKLPWAQWLESKAPFHTSWIIYKIHLPSSQVVSCYCFTKQSFLALSEETLFLPKLFSLPLEEVTIADRKRIGPKPEDAAADQRKLWNPQKFFEGVKDSTPQFFVQRAIWPKDTSLLSLKSIDLYFDSKNPLFPFPYWIEAGDGYNSLHFQVIDSGICKQSPFPHYPKMPPSLERIRFDPNDGLKIHLNHGAEHQSYQIIATRIVDKSMVSCVLPYEMKLNNSDAILITSLPQLKKHLGGSSQYQFTIIPIDDPSLALEHKQMLHIDLP
jgi:hypothetical protein